MGLLDLFRFGRVAVHTAKAVSQQRRSAREMAALPMDHLVAECVAAINSPHAPWKLAARAPQPDAAERAQALGAGAELCEFYARCNGLEALHDQPPAAVLPIEALRTGAEYAPALSAQLRGYWRDNGNDDAENPDRLAVIPPDDLGALATGASEAEIDPAVLDSALVLLAPQAHQCVVLLTAPAHEKLPAGAVLDIEHGAGTRYDGFRHWLATQASLYQSVADIGRR